MGLCVLCVNITLVYRVENRMLGNRMRCAQELQAGGREWWRRVHSVNTARWCMGLGALLGGIQCREDLWKLQVGINGVWRGTLWVHNVKVGLIQR